MDGKNCPGYYKKVSWEKIKDVKYSETEDGLNVDIIFKKEKQIASSSSYKLSFLIPNKDSVISEDQKLTKKEQIDKIMKEMVKTIKSK